MGSVVMDNRRGEGDRDIVFGVVDRNGVIGVIIMVIMLRIFSIVPLYILIVRIPD